MLKIRSSSCGVPKLVLPGPVKFIWSTASKASGHLTNVAPPSVKRTLYPISFKCAVNSSLMFVILLQSLACLTALGQSQDWERILSALPPITGGLAGYTITALETNITFDQNKIALQFLQSGSKTNLSKGSISDTNICCYVYKFGNGVVFVSREQFNTFGKLTQKDTLLITANEVRGYHNPVKADEASGSNTGWAEIRTREANSLSGVPMFLSKSMLRQAMANSPVQSCELGQSLRGENCYIIRLPPPPDTPIKAYKLFLRSDTLAPVELNSYFANEELYSRSDLQFEVPESAPFLFKRVDSQIFEDGELSGRSVWTIERAEKDNRPLTENIESFIPTNTQVCDHRFSKPVNYHMRAHPPTTEQINLMLTSDTGVASYEAGISIPAGVIHNSRSLSLRQYWIRVVFIAIIILPLLIFIPKLFKKH